MYTCADCFAVHGRKVYDRTDKLSLDLIQGQKTGKLFTFSVFFWLKRGNERKVAIKTRRVCVCVRKENSSLKFDFQMAYQPTNEWLPYSEQASKLWLIYQLVMLIDGHIFDYHHCWYDLSNFNFIISFCLFKQFGKNEYFKEKESKHLWQAIPKNKHPKRMAVEDRLKAFHQKIFL